MKFHELLFQRNELLRQARLANMAYAYQWLGDFAERIARAGLAGSVTLYGPDAEQGRQEAAMVANNFSQAVLQEHFLEEEIVELHAVLAFLHGAGGIVELKFQLGEIAARYLPSLRQALEAAEVLPKEETSSIEDASGDATP